MNKKILLFIIEILLVFLTLLSVITGCSDSTSDEIKLRENYVEWLQGENLKKYEKTLELNEYKTEVTAGYYNPDNTKTIFVFASPIRYKNENGDLRNIDTRIKNISDEQKKAQGYKYTVADNDIKVYYPKELSRQKGIQIENTNAYEFGLYTEEVIQPEYVIKDNFIHCEKPMILYKDAIDKQCDVFFYPSSIGTNCEITFNRKPISNEINFWFKSEDEIKLKKEPGGYISLSKTINQKNIIVGVIQPPLLENEQGDVTFENEVRFVKEKNVFTNIDGLLGDDIAPVYFDLYLYQDSIVFGKMVKKDNGTMIVEDSYQLAKGLTVDEFKEIIENT